MRLQVMCQWARLCSVPLALVLIGAAVPASAAPVAPQSPPVPVVGASTTLPTGDQVEVNASAGGFPQLAVTPADRPDGSSPMFTTIELRAAAGPRAFVVPDDAWAGLRSGATRWSRFAVAGSVGADFAPAVAKPADAPTVPLTVAFTDATGQPVVSGNATVVDLTAGPDGTLVYPVPISGGTGTVQVVPGDTYAAVATLSSNTITARRRDLLVSDQVTPTGPAQLALAANADVPLRVTTAQPVDRLYHYAELVLGGAAVRMSVSAGVSAENLGAAAGFDLYVTPHAAPQTGSLSLHEEWFLGDPALEMTVPGEQPMTLHPAYKPFAVRAPLIGDRTVPLVPAGAADESGALVLVGISIPAGVNPVSYASTAASQAAASAAQAGALGTVPYIEQDGALPLPGLGVQPIPQLSVDAAEGAALQRQLASGTVAVHLHATTDPTYLDDLFYQQEGTAISHHTVDPAQLVPVSTAYHAGSPETYVQSWFGFGPTSVVDQNPFLQFHAPTGIVEYAGPADGSVLWSRWTTALAGGKQFALKSFRTFEPGQGAAPAERWFDGPIVEGAPEAADLGNPAGIACGLCRGGPLGDTLVPAWFLQDSDPGHFVQSWPDFNSGIQLFNGASQIAADDNTGATPFPTFPLAARPATYTLTADGPTPVNPGSLGVPQHTTTTWTFQSVRATSATPNAATCPAEVGPTCAFLPLIELHYQMDLDLTNRAPAGAPFTFRVAAVEHSDAVGGGTVGTVQVQASADNGTTWAAADVLPMGQGRFQVTVNQPALTGGSGFVSLRVRASDSAGNTVTQTVSDAYGLVG